MTYETVSEMVQFIYTGKVDNIKNITNGKLVMAFEKYELVHLKIFYENTLGTRLTAANAADLYKAEFLKTPRQ